MVLENNHMYTKSLTPFIDYQKIADAQKFYASHGFIPITVPWIVEYEAYNATRPPDRREFYCLDGYLNASGEQSFIELMINGNKMKKYCCITPCFRDEPILDDYHHRYFLKLELIDGNVTKENLKRMIKLAKEFLDIYTTTPTQIIQTDTNGSAFDILDGITGIELGSYGIRKYKKFSWIYGTGLALPRLDTVITNSSKTKNYVQKTRRRNTAIT
jgi:hypothetical protein